MSLSLVMSAGGVPPRRRNHAASARFPSPCPPTPTDMSRLILLALFLIPANLLGQTASYTFFGTGCDLMQPRLAVTGTPRLGSTFTVTTVYGNTQVSCSTVITPYTVYMATGLSNRNWGGATLPLPIFQTCNLLVAPTLVEVRAVQSGSSCLPQLRFPSGSGVDFTYSVPNDSMLLGLKLYQQMFFAPVRNPAGFLAATNGGIATIGR